MSDNQESEKLKRIKKEITRLNGVLGKLDKKKKRAVESLIKNAAFMAVTLEDLQDEINQNGVTETYQNGANQHGVKKSSAVEVYNTMIKNHVQVMKQLTDMLPKDEPPKPEDDGFEDFVMNK
jgi:cysteinyl-tRNA synthetase